MTSMAEGSTSTIMVEEWQPIFDRFDLESDGKMVRSKEKSDVSIHVTGWQNTTGEVCCHPGGRPCLERICATEPQTENYPGDAYSKDRVEFIVLLQEVDLNKDGVIDYSEFLTLVKVQIVVSSQLLLQTVSGTSPWLGHKEETSI